MNRLLLAITAIYLILEAITATQSSSIFFKNIDLNTLQQTEMMGYITAGFGSALLLTYKIQHRNAILIALIFIASFFITTNGLHWLVEKAPSIFSTSMKQTGVYYGVGILTEPSPQWLSSAYGLSPPQEIKQQNLTSFVSKYGSTDEQNRKMLSAGIRGVGLFTKQWDITIKKLDKQALSFEFKKLHRGVFEMHFVKKRNKNAGAFPSLLTLWPLISPYNFNDGIAYHVLQYRDWDPHEAAWWSMRDKFEFLPITPPRFEQWLDTFNEGLTQSSLKSYLHNLEGEKMPWRGQEPYGELYERACAEVAPFLFNQGNPLLSLAALRNPQVRETYIRELQQPLTPKLRTAMDNYQIDNLHQLMQNQDAWYNPVRAESGLGLVRIVWLTPAMTLLSWFLLVANSWRFSNAILEKTKSNTSPAHRGAAAAVVMILVLLAANKIMPMDVWNDTIKPHILTLGPQEANVNYPTQH